MSGIIIGYVAIGLVLIRILFFGGLAALGAFSHALSKP
jgi:hypothetical protein